VLSLFTRTLSLHDPLLTTARGASIDQLAFGAILAHIRDTPGTLTQNTGEIVDDEPTDALTLVPSSPAADGGFTREIVDLSAASGFPRRVREYDGTSLIREIDFRGVALER